MALRCTLAIAALAAAVLVLALPSAGSGTKPKTLRARVTQLETRVSKLEAQVQTLRGLICLQLPTCTKETP